MLATDTDVAKGGEAHVFRVEPNGAEAQYDQNATASNASPAATSLLRLSRQVRLRQRA